MKKHSVPIPQFNTHVLMAPVYKRSDSVFLKHFSCSMYCQHCISFFLLPTVFRCLAVINLCVGLGATLQFKVCRMRCIQIWLSCQVSRGYTAVSRVCGELLFRIQVDSPQSIMWCLSPKNIAFCQCMNKSKWSRSEQVLCWNWVDS